MPGTVEMYITDKAGGRLRIPLPRRNIRQGRANIITASIIKLGRGQDTPRNDLDRVFVERVLPAST